MSNRETLDYDPVSALIEQGRRELTDGNIGKARWCFEEVLRRRPDEPRALLGLSYAARKSERPPGMDEKSQAEQRGDAASVLSVDVEVVVLVREKRYGEALVKLRAELSTRPDDPALLRSIAHLEQHISRPSTPPTRTPSMSPAEPERLQQASIPKLRALKLEELAKDAALVPPSVATSAAVDILEESEPEEAREVPKGVNTKAAELVVVDEAPRAPAPPAHDAEAEPTVPFELMKAAPTSSLEGLVNQEASVIVSDEALDGEARLDDLLSSGGFPVAEEDPSVPALGSLPPAPVLANNPKSSGGGATWWIFALLAVAAIALALALR